jgi:hypothetical protein
MSRGCEFDTPERCAHDARREQVARQGQLSGIDYVELREDERSLCVHFFGAPPPGLGAGNFVITGGERIRGLRVEDVAVHEHEDGDACLLLTLDRRGDFSPYCLCVVQPSATRVKCSFEAADEPAWTVPEGMDPRYACTTFRFRLDCGAQADCAPDPCPVPAAGSTPAIDYLARDYQGFRRLMLDRLAITMPQWRERHVPDLGITMVELLAFTADQLSYELDAVATEAFLRTARRRISVRRHARLVDYWMHEGLNARAWVTFQTDVDIKLPMKDLVLAAVGPASRLPGGLVPWPQLQREGDATLFEPLAPADVTEFEVVAAHVAIPIYTWRRERCCLPRGSTRATLVDGTRERRALRLAKCDLLLFEETRACDGGADAGADVTHRHVVRLTRVTPSRDPIDGTPLLEIEWHADDALPFDLLLSVRAPAPSCEHLPAAVARGNVLLVDHGASGDESNPDWLVTEEADSDCCICEGGNTVTRTRGRRLTIELASAHVTHADPPPGHCSAAADAMRRDARAALPAARLAGTRSGADREWHAVRDLLACAPDDTAFVMEIDDDGRAHIRFGDDRCGRAPRPGTQFKAHVRTGNGTSGNVGRESITRVALRRGSLSGVTLGVRNPLSARGGMEPESVADAKRHAPHAYGRVLERAVAADDYARLAAQQPGVQGAFAELAWTGSWYEARVAVDEFSGQNGSTLSGVMQRLERARRIGHDLHVVTAQRVALDIELRVCAAPNVLRGTVEKNVRDRLSPRDLFHADNIRLGELVAASRIVAAVQAIPGVAHVEVRRFSRLGASPADAARSLADNAIRLAADELAVLEATPNYPEHGRLVLVMEGGR